MKCAWLKAFYSSLGHSSILVKFSSPEVQSTDSRQPERRAVAEASEATRNFLFGSIIIIECLSVRQLIVQCNHTHVCI